ncbi:MAG: sodium-dependent transporter [Trichlorobacter sp.]|nr:sodium-dependent transporter [Trichlorobacter sp.]
MSQNGSRPLWTSRLGFVLAAAGSAVGLGNIWKFPYIAGANGGGAFVLVYLVCIAVIGLPLMMAELMIGRHTRRDAVGAFTDLAGQHSAWRFAGWLGVGAAFIICSYYSVVAGWSLEYLYKSLVNGFSGKSAVDIESMFDNLCTKPFKLVQWHFLFMALCLAIVISGVQKGIERWSKILMPALFLLMFLLFVNGLLSPGAREGLAFMFRPDFSKLTSASVLEALGHAFFTLSLGMAAMITYGSYLDDREDLLATSLRVVVLDTIIALMAGVAIFSVVFSVGMQPSAGPGLVFKTIPVVFTQLPGGQLLAISFFMLLAFAALTSNISLLEAQVAYLIDEKQWGRRRASAFMALLAFLVGIPTALSFNLLANWQVIGSLTFFDSADLLASNYMLPLGGLLTAVYVGWFWKNSDEKQQLVGVKTAWVYPAWNFTIRYITPLAVAIVLYFKIRESGLFGWLMGILR